MKLPRKLQSRKFWITLISSVIVVASATTGFDLSVVEGAALAVVNAVYVLSEAVRDAIAAGRPQRVYQAAPPVPPPH